MSHDGNRERKRMFYEDALKELEDELLLEKLNGKTYLK